MFYQKNMPFESGKTYIHFGTIEPYQAKTGGLGLFSGLLPDAIAKQGELIRTIAPGYYKIHEELRDVLVTDQETASLIQELLSRNYYFKKTVFASTQPLVKVIPATNGLAEQVFLNDIGAVFFGGRNDQPYGGDNKNSSNTYTLQFDVYGSLKGKIQDISDYSKEIGKDTYTNASDKFLEKCIYFNWLYAAYTIARRMQGDSIIQHLHEWHMAYVPIIKNLLEYNQSPEKIFFTLHNIFNPGIINKADLLKNLFGIETESFSNELEAYFKDTSNTTLWALQGIFANSQVISTVSNSFLLRCMQGALPSVPSAELVAKREQGTCFAINNGYQEDFDIARRFNIDSKDKITGTLSSFKKHARVSLAQILGFKNLDGKMIIGFSHRWSAQKGYFQTMQAINTLLENSKFREDIVFVATSNSKTEFDQKLKDMLIKKHPGKFFVVDYTDDLARDIMQAGDLFLFPSTTQEPFGIQAVNAFASGTPVLANAIDGLKDIVTDSVNGFLFNGFDKHGMFNETIYLQEFSHTLRKAVEIFFSDSKSYQKLYDEAYRRKDMFTWEKTSKEYAESYKKL